MEKFDREQLKKEIIAEVLKELKSKNLNEEYSFKKYKNDATTDDVFKVQTFIANKMKGYGFIPVIGVLIYSYQVQQLLNSLDRGAMRVAITKYQTRNTLGYILLGSVCLPFIINVHVFVDGHVFKKSCKEVREYIVEEKNI